MQPAVLTARQTAFARALRAMQTVVANKTRVRLRAYAGRVAVHGLAQALRRALILAFCCRTEGWLIEEKSKQPQWKIHPHRPRGGI